MEQYEIDKIIVEYLDKHHLDLNRFFSKNTLADWCICDDYKLMHGNVENFKAFICERFEIEKFDVSIDIHTSISEITSIIMVNRLLKK